MMGRAPAMRRAMIRSFIFKNGRLVSQDLDPDMLRLLLYDEDVQMWVDLESPTPDESKAVLETVFNFHPLAIEDCLTVSERPKVDEYENCIFMVIHAVDYSKHEFQTTEFDMFLGKNFLVTYHQTPLRSVTATIDRIQKNAAAVARAPDRLAYTLLDFLLENYEPALNDLSADFAQLERDMLTAPSGEFLNRIMSLKAEVQRLHQIVGPQREVLGRVAHGEFRIVRAHLLPYFRDLLDRLSRTDDLADSYRDTLTNLLQVQLSIQQMRVNEVIKVLTILATLALPIVAIASYYGMNFKLDEHALEGWQAHAWVLGLSGLLTGSLYLYLRLKKWT